MFYDILERKNAFLGYKNKKFKKSKNWHFSKGVNPWFWSKNGHFSTFSFEAIQARKISFTIFQNEKTPFQAIKTRSSKSRKIDIFPMGLTHGCGQKKAIFQTFFFSAIQTRKMSLMIFQIEKTPFKAITTRSSKSRKNDIFPQVFKPKFWSENGQSSNYFFQAIQARNILLRYSRRKKRYSRL